MERWSKETIMVNERIIFGSVIFLILLGILASANVEIYEPLNVSGNISGMAINVTSAKVSNLVSCDTIDTDAGGNMKCGTDNAAAAGAGADIWINDSGGNLSINHSYNQGLNISDLMVTGITNCDTIDTDDDGTFKCGTDSGQTYTNASWELNEIIKAECSDCLNESMINEPSVWGRGNNSDEVRDMTNTTGWANYANNSDKLDGQDGSYYAINSTLALLIAYFNNSMDI